MLERTPLKSRAHEYDRSQALFEQVLPQLLATGYVILADNGDIGRGEENASWNTTIGCPRRLRLSKCVRRSAFGPHKMAHSASLPTLLRMVALPNRSGA